MDTRLPCGLVKGFLGWFSVQLGGFCARHVSGQRHGCLDAVESPSECAAGTRRDGHGCATRGVRFKSSPKQQRGRIARRGRTALAWEKDKRQRRGVPWYSVEPLASAHDPDAGEGRGAQPRPAARRAHRAGEWKEAMRLAGDGTASPDMSIIRRLRVLIWRQTKAQIRINAVPGLGPLGLVHDTVTRCIRHPGKPRAGGNPRVEVANEDCLETARRLVGCGLHVAVLNMGNARRPGGGVEAGAGAQEENLHRRSDACRYLDGQRYFFYPIQEGTCLLSRGV